MYIYIYILPIAHGSMPVCALFDPGHTSLGFPHCDINCLVGTEITVGTNWDGGASLEQAINRQAIGNQYN